MRNGQDGNWVANCGQRQGLSADHQTYYVVIVGAVALVLRAMLGRRRGGPADCWTTKAFHVLAHGRSPGWRCLPRSARPCTGVAQRPDRQGADGSGQRGRHRDPRCYAPEAVLRVEHYGVPFSRTEDGLLPASLRRHDHRVRRGPPAQRTCAAARPQPHRMPHMLYGQSKHAAEFIEHSAITWPMDQDGACRGVIVEARRRHAASLRRQEVRILADRGYARLLHPAPAETLYGDGTPWRAARRTSLEDMVLRQFMMSRTGAGVLITEAAARVPIHEQRG